MKIIVLNLNKNTKVEQLEYLFKRFGAVESCNLVLDKEKGTSKGFGFVVMPDDTEANAAIAGLNGTKLYGHKIRVKVSDSVNPS